MNNVNQISIYDYGDYRAYVKDFYTAKKSASSTFSLTVLARKVAMSKVAVKCLIDKQRHIADDNGRPAYRR